MIVQPNGKGALYAGGVPGNQGGTGRPPSSIKALLRESFAKRIPVLEDVADDKEARAGDRIRAIEVLGTFDLRDKGEDDISEHPEARRFVAAFHMALTEEVTPAIADRVKRKIELLLGTQFAGPAA